MLRLLTVLAVPVLLSACASDSPTMNDDVIIVSGASGQLGGVAVEELLAANREAWAEAR